MKQVYKYLVQKKKNLTYHTLIYLDIESTNLGLQAQHIVVKINIVELNTIIDTKYELLKNHVL